MAHNAETGILNGTDLGSVFYFVPSIVFGLTLQSMVAWLAVKISSYDPLLHEL
jgi:hypothetical protein